MGIATIGSVLRPLGRSFRGATGFCFFILAALLLSACETGHAPIAASVTAAGQLRLLYNPCGRDYRAATEIRITAKDGSTLWHLRSLQVDAGLPEYVAGIVPDGFEEVVPVTSMPRGPVRIVISDTTKSSVAEEVTIERLRMDQVYVPRDGFMRESEFTSLDTCPAGGLLR